MGTFSNKWFYSLEINREKVTATMREIITALEERGVQTRAIWGLINEQLPYLQDDAYKIEKASYYAERILNFPCSTQITEEEIEYVVKQIKEVERGRISEYLRKHYDAVYTEKKGADSPIWEIKVDIALPCATQNEVTLNSAKVLVENVQILLFQVYIYLLL